MGTKRCLVCDSTNKDDVILHRFPKDSTIREEWKKFCLGAVDIVREEDDLTNMLICSKHFLKIDYNKSKYLRANAIPFLTDSRKSDFIDTVTIDITNDVGSPIGTDHDTAIVNPTKAITRRKRKFRDYNYLLASPNNLQQYFEKSQMTLREKNRRIRTLQQRCRRLKNRVKNLKDQVKHLKKNFISDQDEEIIILNGFISDSN